MLLMERNQAGKEIPGQYLPRNSLRMPLYPSYPLPTDEFPFTINLRRLSWLYKPRESSVMRVDLPFSRVTSANMSRFSNAVDLFSVEGVVAVVTGGGTGTYM